MAPQIEEVARELSESRLSEEQRKNLGFLRPYSAETYADFARNADHFYSVVDGDLVAAFFLAHSSTNVDLEAAFSEARSRNNADLANDEIYSHIKTIQTEPFFSIRQIAVPPNHAGKAIGPALYFHFIRQVKVATVKHRTAIGVIWKKPYHNTRSEEFHRKLKCRELGSYALRDGSGLVGIWALPLSELVQGTKHP